MEFKELDIKPKGSRLNRIWRTHHSKRTIIAVAAGATIGFAIFYFSEGRLMDSMAGGDILKSILIGGFFGFFFTNSPCARGRC